MTDVHDNPAPLQAEPASPSEVAGLNARTARRQRLLLGGIGALALVGGTWFILGGDEDSASDDPQAAQTIDTAGLVNRDLSQREFVASYGNRLDAVTLPGFTREKRFRPAGTASAGQPQRASPATNAVRAANTTAGCSWCGV